MKSSLVWGADEFAFLMTERTGLENCLVRAGELLRLFETPVGLESGEYHISLSLGGKYLSRGRRYGRAVDTECRHSGTQCQGSGGGDPPLYSGYADEGEGTSQAGE
ncbi:hypothetical protein ACFSQ7_41755 [Paenibacillus rhizoplanae]